MRLEILDRALLREVDRCLEQGARRAGDRLACRPGCTRCCIGVFTINALDAWRLERGIEELERLNAAKARAVRERAEEILRQVQGQFPGAAASGLLDEDMEKVDEFTERFSNLACPALNPDTGLCELYAYRPMSCRTFGLPVLEGNEKLPPCPLCFQGSSSKEIEDCRVKPDPDDLENAILCELPDVEADGCRETIVAYALTPDARLASDDRIDESRAD